MTRQELINALQKDVNIENNGYYAIILCKKNFYTKKTFIDIITTTDSYTQAQIITNELAKVYNKELVQCDASVSFATIDVFTRGYNYNFAKQS